MAPALVTCCCLFAVPAWNLAQQPAFAPANDVSVEAAQVLVNRGLFLRCLCSDTNLTFDAGGHASTATHATDWTLAGVTIQHVERKSPMAIELTGVRAFIRYAADRREFERRAQNEDKARITLPDDPANPLQFERTLDAVFAFGMDPALQRSMPAFWQHFFNPALPWPPDELTGQMIYQPHPASEASAAVTPATVTHKSEPSYTTEAQHDKIQGQLQLRFVVTPAGAPARIEVLTPLGYGLDARAVESAAKLRFMPALRGGQPVPSYVTLGQDFVLVPAPR